MGLRDTACWGTALKSTGDQWPPMGNSRCIDVCMIASAMRDMAGMPSPIACAITIEISPPEVTTSAGPSPSEISDSTDLMRPSKLA